MGKKVRDFFVATEKEIKKGETTDIYFIRTVEILKNLNKINTDVSMEITSGKLPYNWSWGILSGTLEVIKLIEGVDADLYLMPEGTLFKPVDDLGIRMPLGYIEGKYGKFAIYETPLLGLLCQSSGISTYASHLRYIAWDKILLSFGARRMHPGITPLIDYAAYIGGFNGVSSVLSAKKLGLEPQGTMPHALIIVVGDQVEAWKAFDKYVDKKVKRIALIDTFYDEKVEALMAAEALKDRLFGVRVDTPKSRRGNIKEIIEEIRWELDIRGYEHVKIMISGGVNHENILEMVEAGADGFGIGTSVSNAATLDFALDIVEKEGKPIAKKGKMSGRKQVYRCPKCFTYIVKLIRTKKVKCPKCGGDMKPLIKKVIEKGRVAIDIPSIEDTRQYVLKQLSIIRDLEWGG